MVSTLRLAGCLASWRLRVLAGLTLLLVTLTSSAAISVGVEPDPPRQGESFRLAFSLEGDFSTPPDFSVLEEDFEILARNEQNAVSFVNGKYTRKTTWVVEVLPRDTGAVKIPAVQIGELRSKAFTVTPRPTPSSASDDGLFLEVEAVPPAPYVQQEVLYTVRLWRRYELSNASLSEPQLSADALVKPLTGDRQYVRERNGRRYDVVERRYLIYPQESGTVTIQPVRVTAQVLERAASLFEMLGRAVKTRRVDSLPITLEVRPVPAEFPAGAHWLPARLVRLNELWTPESGPVKVGEPLSRTLSLWASGVTSGQLPPLVPQAVDGLRQYPDQPQLQDTLQDETHNAVRQEKIAYVADRPGPRTLPAVAIPWWNTETDALEYAELPSRPMTVEALPGTERPTPPPAAPAQAELQEPVPSATRPPEALLSWRHWPGWFGVAILAVLGWAITTFWLLKRGPRQHAKPHAPMLTPVAPESTARAMALLEATCAADDAAASQRAVLAWAATVWPERPPLTLDALTRRVAPPLEAALAELDRACHGPTSSRWQGSALSRALKSFVIPSSDQKPGRPEGRDGLPSLFRLSEGSQA